MNYGDHIAIDFVIYYVDIFYAENPVVESTQQSRQQPLHLTHINILHTTYRIKPNKCLISRNFLHLDLLPNMEWMVIYKIHISYNYIFKRMHILSRQ